MHTISPRRLSKNTKALIGKLNDIATGPSSRLLTSEDLDASGAIFTRVTARNYRQNATVAAIDAGTWAAGDCVVCTDAGSTGVGTPLAVAVGDVIEWNGTSWVKILGHSSNKVPAGTRLLVSPGVLTTPLTDATHENYVASFSGLSNSPTLTAPTDGMVVVVKGENSIFENATFVYDTGRGWVRPDVCDAFAANPTVTADINMGFAPGSKWVNTATREEWTCTDATAGAAKWSAGGYGLTVAKAAAADRLGEIAATTDVPFATTFTLPNSPPVGTRVKVQATIKVHGSHGNDTFAPKIKLEGVELAALAAYDAADGDVIQGVAEFMVSAAGTVDILHSYFVKAGVPGNGVTTPAVDVAVTLSSTPVITVESRWSAQNAGNIADLRGLSVLCFSPNIG